MRKTITLLLSSISRMRFFNSIHLRRYEFSTELGKTGVGAMGDLAVIYQTVNQRGSVDFAFDASRREDALEFPSPRLLSLKYS